MHRSMTGGCFHQRENNSKSCLYAELTPIPFRCLCLLLLLLLFCCCCCCLFVVVVVVVWGCVVGGGGGFCFLLLLFWGVVVVVVCLTEGCFHQREYNSQSCLYAELIPIPFRCLCLLLLLLFWGCCCLIICLTKYHTNCARGLERVVMYASSVPA